MTMAGIVQNGALAISKAIAASFSTMGMPWTAIIAGQTALQLGIAAATPLPAKGYQDGMYDNIMREQDGKVFRARNGGSASSQEVTSPTYFNTPTGRILTGENSTLTRPEIIIDTSTWAGFPDSLKSMVRRQIMGARGYEKGMYRESVTAAPSFSEGGNDTSSTVNNELLQMNIKLLRYLAENGVVARISDDMLDIKNLDDEIQRYRNLKNQNKV